MDGRRLASDNLDFGILGGWILILRPVCIKGFIDEGFEVFHLVPSWRGFFRVLIANLLSLAHGITQLDQVIITWLWAMIQSFGRDNTGWNHIAWLLRGLSLVWSCNCQRLPTRSRSRDRSHPSTLLAQNAKYRMSRDRAWAESVVRSWYNSSRVDFITAKANVNRKWVLFKLLA